MNTVVWAAMQPAEVLAAVDYMIPDLVDEDELDSLDRMMGAVHYAKEQMKEKGFFEGDHVGVLTAVGLALWAIPDPLVFAVGTALAGGNPVGGYVAVAVVNVAGAVLILVDYVI